MVAGIVTLAKEIREREAERARKEAQRQRAQECYLYQKQRLEAERAKLKQFEEHALAWESAQRLRAYADAVERHALATNGLTEELQDWLAWARAKADWIDPLIQVSDPILSAPEPQPPGYYYY